MATVQKVLLRYDTGSTESDIADGLARALNKLPGVDAEQMSDNEVAYLAAHAGGDAAATIDGGIRPKSTASAPAPLPRLSNVWPADRWASTKLRPSRTLTDPPRHGARRPALYSIPIGARRRIPARQFHNRTEVSGPATVVASIPTGAHPRDVEAAMTRTPVDHVASGGDPTLVAQLLSELARW